MFGPEFSDVGTHYTAKNDTRPARAVNSRSRLQYQKTEEEVPTGSWSASCAYCTWARKECVFEKTPFCTPLMKKNLDAIERRCRQLEELVWSLGQGALMAKPSWAIPLRGRSFRTTAMTEMHRPRS